MRRLLILFGSLIVSISLLVSSYFTETSNALSFSSGEVRQSYFVGFSSTKESNLFEEQNKKMVKKKYSTVPVLVLELTQEEVNQLVNNPAVSYVEEDAQVKALNYTIPWGVSSVKAPSVHLLGYTGKGIKVGVMDSGVNQSHQDLRVVDGVSFISTLSPFMDNYGHGTHVAGIIAALNNSYGTLGVAPQAELYSIRVLDDYGKGRYSDIVDGLEWAIAKELDIINMSFGGDIKSKTLETAVKKAYDNGILLVAPAGNAGYNGKKSTILYPAAYSWVISVGAVDPNNNRAIFSSGGSELDLMAPGVNIYSTQFNSYGYNSGTSMAAPHVSGCAALIRQKYPNISNDDLKEIIIRSATKLGEHKMYGYGLINVEEAIGLMGQSKK